MSQRWVFIRLEHLTDNGLVMSAKVVCPFPSMEHGFFPINTQKCILTRSPVSRLHSSPSPTLLRAKHEAEQRSSGVFNAHLDYRGLIALLWYRGGSFQEQIASMQNSALAMSR